MLFLWIYSFSAESRKLYKDKHKVEIENELGKGTKLGIDLDVDNGTQLGKGQNKRIEKEAGYKGQNLG